MTVRNCAPFLPKVFENIDALRTLFPSFVLIVAYDHCEDGSETLLKYYQRMSSFPVYLLPDQNSSPYRTVRIANARNRCLDQLEKLKLDHPIDIHFMIDADDVNIEPWNLTLIRYYLSNRSPDWDVMTFNRSDYYDIWALMYPPFQHHCWGFARHSREVVSFMKKDIQQKLKQYELFPCQSAFNGFAIYKSNVFHGKRYCGEYKELKKLIPEKARQQTLNALSIPKLQIDPFFRESCEHLYYHLSVPNAKIFISSYCIQ
jgi:glycosyltransferase involved in cell wall biosynthesis